MRRHGRFGLNVVNSPRFVCDLKLQSDDQPPFTVRLFVKHRGNALAEFENMRLLWQEHYAQSATFQMPEPLGVDSVNSLLFLRHWPGQSFLSIFYGTLVNGRPARPALLRSYVEGAANWLVDFQRIAPAGNEQTPPEELARFEERVGSVDYLAPAVRRRIIDKLRGLQNTLPKLPESYVHDQYLLRNILYSQGRICVVDYPHLRRGWPLYDFFTFYTGLERLRQYPLYSRELAESMKDLFARTYFSGRGASCDRVELQNLWAFFLAAYLVAQYSKKTTGRLRRALNNRFIHRMYDGLARWSET